MDVDFGDPRCVTELTCVNAVLGGVAATFDCLPPPPLRVTLGMLPGQRAQARNLEWPLRFKPAAPRAHLAAAGFPFRIGAGSLVAFLLLFPQPWVCVCGGVESASTNPCGSGPVASVVAASEIR